MARTSNKPVETLNEEVVVEKTIPKKKFNTHDLIECRSLTCGTLLMCGGKSRLTYRWGDLDEVQEVEYQDLIYDVHSSNSFAKYPRFIVLDDDFVEQNKLQPIYDALYSKDDIRKILDLPADQMKEVVDKLPKGVKESIRTLSATLIQNGTLDSISKIKVLDEIFGTQMLLHLAGN